MQPSLVKVVSLRFGRGDGRMLGLGSFWFWALRVCLDLVFVGSMWIVLFRCVHSWFRIWDPGSFCIKIWDLGPLFFRVSIVIFYWDQYPCGTAGFIDLRKSTSLLLDSAKKVYCQFLFSLLSHVLNTICGVVLCVAVSLFDSPIEAGHYVMLLPLIE